MAHPTMTAANERKQCSMNPTANLRKWSWIQLNPGRAAATAMLMLLALPAPLQAQFNYTTNNGTITITGYTGSGGAVTIPSTTNGLPVTAIGGYYEGGLPPHGVWRGAFYECNSVTSVTIPSSVTNIDEDAFVFCFGILAITVDTNNPVYSSLAGVLFNKNWTILIECPEGKGGWYTVPDSVTSIGDSAFYQCRSLTSVAIPNSVTSIGGWAFAVCTSLGSVTIPNSVTNLGVCAFWDCTSLDSVAIGNGVTSIGEDAFSSCTSLASVAIGNGVTSIGESAFDGCESLTSVTIPSSVTTIGASAFDACYDLGSVYLEGNAPSASSLGGVPVFELDTRATVYYLPGTMGWGTTFGGLPTALWNPQPQSISVQGNKFGFTITGTPDIPIVVEASTDLQGASWTSLQSCTLTNGSIYFSDPQWTNYPTRYYRIRSP